MVLIANNTLRSGKFTGITLWPFVILKNQNLKNDKFFLNHERIHLRQQLEMLVIFFYIWYLAEYLWRYLKSGNSLKAYKNISLEREAYRRENDLTYLKNRPFWAFLKFL